MSGELFGPVWTPVLLVVSALIAGVSGLVLWRSLLMVVTGQRPQKTQNRVGGFEVRPTVRTTRQYN